MAYISNIYIFLMCSMQTNLWCLPTMAKRLYVLWCDMIICCVEVCASWTTAIMNEWKLGCFTCPCILLHARLPPHEYNLLHRQQTQRISTTSTCLPLREQSQTGGFGHPTHLGTIIQCCKWHITYVASTWQWRGISCLRGKPFLDDKVIHNQAIIRRPIITKNPQYIVRSKW